jgi:uncharacterized protein YunC (DUF1805 family)
MSSQVQFRRGTATQNNAFTGAVAEITYDTDNKTLRLHDGTTAGGGATVLTTGATQTVLNKTFSTGSNWNGTPVPLQYGGTGSALTAAAGAVPYSTSSGMGLSLSGTSGQLLTSGGSGSPTWVSASTLTVGTASTATTAQNIAGGSAGQLMIQSDINLTTFITAGAYGTFLQSQGAGYAPSWAAGQVTIGNTTVALGGNVSGLQNVSNIIITTGTTSTNANTGAFINYGGAGIGGNLNVAGNIVSTSTSYTQISSGTTAQRPQSATFGMIRYNSTISSYEGFGAGSTWSSLGGVKSVDAKAYITAEASAGAGDDVIRVYAGDSGTSTQIMWASTSNIKILPTTTSTSSTSGALQVAGGAGVAGDLYVGATLNATGAATLSSTLAVNGASLTTTQTTFNLVNATASTLNIGGAATALNIGASSGTLTIGNPTITGTNATALNLNGASPVIATTSTTASVFNTNATTLNIGGAATALNLGASTGTTTVNNNLTVTGSLTVNGTTTTINATTLSVNDLNIEIGKVASPTDTTANGGGITLKGATDKTISWDSTNANWTSSEHWNIASGKTFKIAATEVLSATTLFTGQTTASLAPSATALTIGAANSGTVTLRNATTAISYAATVGTTLGVTGATTLSSTLGVTGAATLSSTLAVTSTSTFTGATTHNGGLSSTSGSFSTTLGVTGATTLAGMTATTGSFSSTLGVTGATTLSSTLGVTSTSTFTGATTHNGGISATSGSFSTTLGVTGATTLSSTLAVTSTSNFTGATNHAAGIVASTVQAATIGNASATLTGTLSTASQPNITTLGGVTSIGASSSTTLTGTLQTAAQNNITSASALATVGTITSGTWSASFGAVSGANLTSLTAGNLTGTIPSAVLGNSTLYVGTTAIALNRATTSQTLTGVSIDGNAGTAGGLAVATGRNSSANQIVRTDGSGYIQCGYINSSNGNENNNSNADRVWGTNGSDDYMRTYRTSALSVGYSATVGINYNNTSNSTYQMLWGSGNSVYGTAGIYVNPYLSYIYATQFNGKATSANYADLAENYQADAAYEPGTVLVFGGDAEVTTTTTSHDTAVAGIVSTNPAHLMNAELQGDTVVALGLTGRLPCRVQGPVRKGQVLVTSTTPGVAEAIDNSKFIPGCVVGKALEAINTNTIETIEVVVGRF